MSGFTVRAARPDDIPFLVGSVRASEQLPGNASDSMYHRIYGLSDSEVDQLVTESLSAETEGHQLSLGSFLIVSHFDTQIGCCARWIENAGGKASGARLAMLISRSLGLSRWRTRAAAIRAISGSAPLRSVGALQLESFFVAEAFRGMGIVGTLVNAAIRSVEGVERSPTVAEISLLVENEAATRAYRKLGFDPVHAASIACEQFVELTGSSGFIQLRRYLATLDG